MTNSQFDFLGDVVKHLRYKSGDLWVWSPLHSRFEVLGGTLFYCPEKSEALCKWFASPGKHPHPGPPFQRLTEDDV